MSHEGARGRGGGGGGLGQAYICDAVIYQIVDNDFLMSVNHDVLKNCSVNCDFETNIIIILLTAVLQQCLEAPGA